MRGLGGGICSTVVKNINPLLKKNKNLHKNKVEMGTEIEGLKDQMKNVQATLDQILLVSPYH